MSTSHPAAQLLETLFGKALNSLYLEIRPLAPDNSVVASHRRYLRLCQLQRQGFGGAVPTDLDGRANVYFGVCPRKRQGGTAADVARATSLWVDEIRKPWPAFLFLPTAMVETSPGKHQAYWVLNTPTKELHRVERVNRRLAAVLGGDAVWDRARIMRLPGFLNVKPEHPERPRARLLEVHPNRRYSLDDLEAILPPAEQEGSRSEPTTGHNGRFDPHAGGVNAPADLKDQVAHELIRRGARWHSDGRLCLPCPFPNHGSEHHLNFYYSPLSGRWWCFGANHPGRRADRVCASGDVYTLQETFFSDADHDAHSLPRVRVMDTADLLSTTPTTRGREDSAGASEERERREEAKRNARELFPLPPGVTPAMTTVAMRRKGDSGWGVLHTMISNTWRNEANAQHRRRGYYLWFGVRFEEHQGAGGSITKPKSPFVQTTKAQQKPRGG